MDITLKSFAWDFQSRQMDALQDSKEATEIKTIINSLLVSNPLRTTVQQLWKDFYDMEGRAVPFKKLGFTSFEDYLRSIPDTVNIHGSGPRAEVELIVSSKSEHINEMVLKQKKNVRNKSSIQKRTVAVPRVRTHRPNPQTLSLHIQNNFPLENVHTCKNYTVLKDFDIIPRVQTPNTNFQTNRESQNWLSTVGESSKNDTETPKWFSTVKEPLRDIEYKKGFSAVTKSPMNNNKPQKWLSTGRELTKNDIESSKMLSTVGEPLNKDIESQKWLSTVSKPLNCDIRSQKWLPTVGELSKNDIETPKWFSTVGEPLHRDLEFQKWLSTVEETPKSYVDAESQKNGANILKVLTKSYPVSQISLEDCISFPDRVDYTTKVPVKVQNNLIQLVQKFPQGIKCTKLPQEYRNLFKKKIVYEDYGYRSLIEMCSDLPKIFSYVKHCSDDYLLFDTKNSSPPTVEEEGYPKKPVQTETIAKTPIWEELPIHWSSSSPLIPADVITISDEISRFFPSDVRIGDILDISLGEIYDLSKFWIYMTFGGLEEFMDDLQTFFFENHATYLIPRTLLEEGLYCVALFGSTYHRCVIVNMLPTQANFIRVLFVDYGTVSNVATDSIWFLPRKFGELPCQAMRARLSNIYPVYDNRPWSACAVARFEKLVSGRVIVAKVTKIDEKDNTFEVYLADITNKDNVFYINDIFVKEELALYTDQEQRKRLPDPNCLANVKYIHLYPEFYEIESGAAPTTEEMKYIVANKIPLHYFMPQYFDLYYNENIELTQLEYESRYNQKKIKDIKIPAQKKLEDFDLSFFPDSIRPRINELLEEKLGIKKEKNENKSKEESQSGTDGGKQSVTEYFCNKKRISGLIYGDSPSKTPNVSIDFCDNAFSNISPVSEQTTKNFNDEISSLSNSLQRLSANDSGSDKTSPTRSNPFLNNYKFRNSNPFRPRNPFLSDLEETVNDSGLLNIFTKSSDDVLPQRVINNLKDSHKCACKVSKQVNIERSNAQNNIDLDVSAIVSPEIRDDGESTTLVRRVRTPPGFNSENLNSVSFAPFTGYWNFVSNNPYYQRMPFPPFNPNDFVTQTQAGMPLSSPLMETYYNYLLQMYPNLYHYTGPPFPASFPFKKFNCGPPRYP